MKHPLYSTVIVKGATDETCDSAYIGKKGMVISHKAEGFTGDTEDDPLHVVRFDTPMEIYHESFWYEELEIIN